MPSASGNMRSMTGAGRRCRIRRTASVLILLTKVTFTDYAIAVRHRAAYDGIGIGVFGDICAIDIDSCVENGVLSDMAKDIITRMNTYTEYSPSGTGVRILFKASLPAYDKDRYCINNRRIKLEVYE